MWKFFKYAGLAIFLLILLPALGITGWIYFYTPTPIDELPGVYNNFTPDIYQESLSADPEQPEILILGSSHLAQIDHDFSTDQFNEVTASLSAYSPDMLIIENLPHHYSQGKGRDYRPDINLDVYQDSLAMSYADADSIIALHRHDQNENIAPCKLARAYFLRFDLTNAHYHSYGNSCDRFRSLTEVQYWFDYHDDHEWAKLGFPIARKNNIKELVSFDYQGDDAEWFIFDELIDEIKSGKLLTLREFFPVIKMRREFATRQKENLDSLTDLLNSLNGPEQIGLQYWAYEQEMLNITTNNAGRRQLENYWLRNQRMFEYMEQAISQQNPQRVLPESVS